MKRSETSMDEGRPLTIGLSNNEASRCHPRPNREQNWVRVDRHGGCPWAVVTWVAKQWARSRFHVCALSPALLKPQPHHLRGIFRQWQPQSLLLGEPARLFRVACALQLARHGPAEEINQHVVIPGSPALILQHAVKHSQQVPSFDR